MEKSSDEEEIQFLKNLKNDPKLKSLPQKAMEIMDHVVCVEDGWLVDKFKDGSTIKLKKL